MNILIVGNGFDLSHYLPTKYDHFMDVMGAIEAKDTGGLPKNLAEKSIDEWLNLLEKTFQEREGIASPPHDMAFDELFYKTRDPKFIEKTKEFYLTESVEMCAKDVLRLQYRLELNCWYQYFKNHVEEIKTWIDFEQKIGDVLDVFAKCISDIEKLSLKNELYEYFNQQNKEGIFLNKKNSKILGFFQFVVNEKYEDYEFGIPLNGKPRKRVSRTRDNVNSKFCHGENLKNGFSPTFFSEYLSKHLEEFIEIFNLYLELVISQLSKNTMIEINSKEWSSPDKIFSFNCTNTYQRLHDSVTIEYLHGSCGEYQNIVLGVDELRYENLRYLKAYGFTKYHQKIFKDTDYLFLDQYKEKIRRDKIEIETLNRQTMMPMGERYVRSLHEELGEKEQSQKLDLNFLIWGHSLDVSDQDYIKDLFSLNDEIDRNVRVTVYYFNKTAKFDLLNNLLAILGKDKVEHWMKNKWLCFEPNPEIKFIAQENSDIDQAS